MGNHKIGRGSTKTPRSPRLVSKLPEPTDPHGDLTELWTLLASVLTSQTMNFGLRGKIYNDALTATFGSAERGHGAIISLRNAMRSVDKKVKYG